MGNTPVIRFKGFTDDWEERKLSDMANVKTGFPFKNENFVDDGRYLVITNGNIQNDSAFVDGKVGNRITAVTDEIKEKYTLNYGDILVTMDGTVGRTAKVVEGNQILAQRVGRLVSESTSEFIYQWLNTGKFFTEMTKVSHGGTIKHISLSEIGDYVAYVPTSKDEREKIGSLLLNIDKTITLHQRKLDLLKKQKKGFLQKMFPKNGAKVPELRFAGFADDWEERKLSDVMTLFNGRAYKQPELLDSGKYPVLRVGNFGTNEQWYYSDLELDEKYYANDGDLLYTWSTAFGPHVWRGDKVIYHYHIWKLDLSEAIKRDFAVQVLEYDKAKLLANTNGSTMIHVTKGEMEKKKIAIPLTDEQDKIGDLFTKLDNLIALHQRKLDSLKEQKKGFLQKMFV